MDHSSLGRCLYLNLHPKEKTCTLNCVYCPVGSTINHTTEREEYSPKNEIFAEIYHYITKHEQPDYIWLQSRGEPALYLQFGNLVQKIKNSFKGIKVAVWTNSTLFPRWNIREEFSKCDLIISDLDSVLPKEFTGINRPHKDINHENVLLGIREFKKWFSGVFRLHTVFLNGLNDTEGNLEGLKKFLADISPEKYYVTFGQIKGIDPVTDGFKSLLNEKFSEVPYEITFLN